MFTIQLQSGNLLLLLAILVIVAVMSQKLGSRFGVPSMLLVLIIGMAAGNDGFGLQLTNLHMAEFLCHLAIAIILITGGLHTDMKETKPVLRQGALLSTLGVILTVALTGAFIYFVSGRGVNGTRLSVFASLLVAAILSSTDSTSVFSILHSRKLHLRENLGPLIELESGSNDPMAYILTILLTGIITGGGEFISSFPSEGVMAAFSLLVFLYQAAMGLLLGRLFGRFGAWLIQKINPGSAPLVSILTLSVAFLTDGISTILGASGLLAMYVAAIRIGNSGKLPEKREVLKFFDGISWLAQLLMVLILGLLANPSNLPRVIVPALLIGLFMMFVARPASVFLTLLPFKKLPVRAKMLVSWVGLKGAGPILFALYAVVHNVEQAGFIFDVVVVVTILSLTIQGMTLPAVAKKLNLIMDEDPEVENFGLDLPEEMGMLRDHIVGPGELQEGADTLRDMHLPHGIRVMMVRRDGKFLVPHGSMKLETGDHLLIVMGDTDDE